MKRIKQVLVILIALALNTPAILAQQSPLSRVAGRFVASNYAKWQGQVTGNPTAVGAATISLARGDVARADGVSFTPYSVSAPIIVGTETVTPTAVSGCVSGASYGACLITATFANTHGSGDPVTSGTFGLQEAINDAFAAGGGVAAVDKTWAGTNAMLTAAVPYGNVSIEDTRFGAPIFWMPIGGLTTLAAPTTLVAATAGFSVNGANLTGGFYTGSNTYIACIAYVDILGQEGPCSASFTIATSGSATTDQIGFTAPAASAGAVGYTIYITLNGGAFVSAYKVPLVSQPTVVGVYPASNGVCTLTTLEAVTPACAVANTTYGQAGVGAVVSALTLNTSPIGPAVTVVSTTSIYVPNAGGRTTYAYVPGSHVGFSGMPSAWLPFTISAADATTVPSVIGTVNVLPGLMNFLGRTLEICGYATTSASTGTIQDIQFQWDSMGQNTAGKGVVIGDLTVTKTATSVLQITFCEDFQTTVVGATATAGSIQNSGGFITSSIASLSAAAAGGNTIAGATASLNLAADARINVIYLHTTGTDGTAITLQSLSAKVIN